MSQLTTHILDTTKGKPAQGISIILYQLQDSNWVELVKGVTNKDGRIPDLLSKGTLLEPGNYKIKFEVKAYFDADGINSFYPYVEIVFDISTQEHYHIPLLLSPFGYSTYRGS